MNVLAALAPSSSWFLFRRALPGDPVAHGHPWVRL